MAEKKATTGRLVLIMQDYVPEEKLAHCKDAPEKRGGMLMLKCEEMHYMVCAQMHLWLMAGHKVKQYKRQRNERICGMYTAKAEAVNVLQDVKSIYRKGSRIRCRKKGGKMVA